MFTSLSNAWENLRRILTPIRIVGSLILDVVFFVPAMILMICAVLLYALVGVITREENFFNLLDESIHDHQGREHFLEDHAFLRHFEVASLAIVAIVLFPASIFVFIGRFFETGARNSGMATTFGGAILLVGQLPFRIALYYMIIFGQWMKERRSAHA